MELNGTITENRVDLDGTISAKKTLSGSLSRPGRPITVDDALSDTSENPVQNKVVTAALGNKLSTTGDAYRSASIPMGHLDSTSTATVMTAQVDGITELRDGVCMWLRNGVITSASGFTLNVNGLGAKPCYSSAAAASRSTTIFNVNYTMLFVYNEDRVDGGCWDIVYGVDTNTTYTPPKLGFGYGTCTTAAATVAKIASISSYTLVAGGIVAIKFDNDVPAGATLNISSKGAKAIYYKGASITAGVIKAGDTVTMIYSTYYHVLSIDRGGSDITIDNALSTTSENPVQNKVVKAALDGKGTYSKPSGGIPASDLASGVIPTVPTKTSDLTNDSGFVNAAGAAAAAPVKSVNGQTGAVTVQAATDAQVSTAVNTWCGNNIAQETGYVLDRSLSLANAAAPADLVIDKTGIGGVTPQNLQIVDVTWFPNLIDESKIEAGKYIIANGTSGEGNYKVTDYLPVVAGEKYCFTWQEGTGTTRKNANCRWLACYNSNKEIIASAGSNTAITEWPITIAENVSFVRLSFSWNTYYSKYQFERGETYTQYHPYGVSSAIIKTEYIPDVDLSQIPAFHLVDGQNLWNKNDPDLQTGKFLYNNGTVSDNSGYTTGGFIEVSPGDRLVGSYQVSAGMGVVLLRTVAAYDANKTAVSTLGKYSVQEYIVPDGISYVRICVGNSYGANIQIQKLASDESYYPYKEYEAPHYELDPDYMFQTPAHPVHVFLPKDIYVAVGRTIELYNEQIVLDHEKYHFRWGCGKGAAYQRKFSITGTAVEDLGLSLELYDDKKTLCWCGRSTIHVVAADNPSKKILPIGDSLTNWKAWLQETMLLSNGSITFVGTRYSGQSVDSEGNIYASGSIHHEGRSGWAADSYLANTEYTFDNRYDGVSSVSGAANPFWDGTKFSLNHYLTTQTGVPTPDAVQIFLGTNDLTASVESAVTNITAMVTSIRSEYADLPIFVCNTIFRSNQNGYGSTGSDAYAGGAGAGAWQYDQDARVMDLMVGLRASLANVTGVYFIPLASCMDREYSFGQVMTKVNPRSTIEIPMPAESVHPQASGYYQMADVMYSTYCGVL